jgi:hypothetical protein
MVLVPYGTRDDVYFFNSRERIVRTIYGMVIPGTLRSVGFVRLFPNANTFFNTP